MAITSYFAADILQHLLELIRACQLTENPLIVTAHAVSLVKPYFHFLQSDQIWF